MSKRTVKNRSIVKKILKRELASRNKYKTTYKDIKKFFNMINKAILQKLLHCKLTLRVVLFWLVYRWEECLQPK